MLSITRSIPPIHGGGRRVPWRPGLPCARSGARKHSSGIPWLPRRDVEGGDEPPARHSSSSSCWAPFAFSRCGPAGAPAAAVLGEVGNQRIHVPEVGGVDDEPAVLAAAHEAR